MTASNPTTAIRSFGPSAVGDRFIGVRAIARKDLAAWAHSLRPWVILAVTGLFMTLSAANAAITAFIIDNLPAGAAAPQPLPMDPLQNLATAASAQIFAFAAIFASMGILTGERERGTLAWVASKPVARGAIWLSAWGVASAVVIAVAVLVPFAATVALVAVLYGTVSPLAIAAMAMGMAASVALFMAVGLAASTVTTSQAAVAAIGFAVLFVPQILAGLLPVDIMPFLPTSIAHWALASAAGIDAGFVTPIAWAVGMAALIGLSTRQMGRLEL